MWLLVNHTKPTKILYWQNSGQLQNNTVNGTVSISINRVITKWKHGTSFQYVSCKVLVASLRHCDLLVWIQRTSNLLIARSGKLLDYQSNFWIFYISFCTTEINISRYQTNRDSTSQRRRALYLTFQFTLKQQDHIEDPHRVFLSY